MDVSVVIPAYNAENFIRRCLKRVLSQVHCPSEIIVVNDGSSDNTALITKEYEYVLLVNQQNLGRSGARNSGLRRGQWQWVAFPDVNNQWESAHLQNAVSVLQKDPDWVSVVGKFMKMLVSR